MISYEDNRLKTFDELRERQEEYGYSAKLLTALEKGDDLNCLYEISMADRNNKAYMEPLLFAVLNDTNNAYTYEVFQYYGEELQKQELTTMAAEIAAERPDILKGTRIVDDPESVIYLAKINSEVVMYMSDDLKRDGEFIEELCKTGDKDIIRYAASECNLSEVIQDNPKLANNATFMAAAIKEDANALQYADESLRNDYNFIKEVANENYGVVGYIIDNGEQFGLEAVKGAKEITQKLTVDNSRAIIDEMSQKSEDIRYEKVAKKLDERGEDNKYATRWSTAMAAQSGNVTPEYFRQVLDDSILAMMEIKKDLTVEGKEKVSVDSALRMVTPQILNKLKLAAIENGLEVDEELESKFAEYTEFFNSYRARLQEMKKQNRERASQITQKNNGEIAQEEVVKEKAKALNQETPNGEYAIGHDAVEKVAMQSTPSEMNGEFKIMEGILEAEKTNDKMEVENYDERPKVER